MAEARIDWAAEGLLDGLDESARAARAALLDKLVAEGVTQAELGRATTEGVLAALPSLILLGGPPRHTAREAAERNGLDLDFVLAVRRANGVPLLDPDAPLLSDADLDVGDIARAALDYGVNDEQILATARVMGHATHQIAEQMGSVLFELAYKPGLDERELAERLARHLAQLQPLIAGVVTASMRIHMREAVKDAAIAAAQRTATDGLPGSRPMAVAFADLVGFTRLGEELPVEQLERVANRLSVLVSEAVNPPVRFVKMIGDAAMLVSPEPVPLVETTLDLVAAADAAGPDFPQLRAGVTYGPALSRGGDWFGRPVNLASRLTALARAGSLLATREVRDATEDAPVRWSSAGSRRVRGLPEPVALYRARREVEAG